MTPDKAKTSYIVLSEYSTLYEKKYKVKPNLNKYKEKWAIASLIEDYGSDTVFKMLEYYFVLSKEGHPLVWFYNNFDQLVKANKENEQDAKNRAERRAETARLRQEYLNGNA